MKESRTHIIKRGNGWAVKRQGANKASKIYHTQQEAVKGAKRLKNSSEIIVHRRNGSVGEWINSKN